MAEYVTIWPKADSQANDILRALMQQVKYTWAWRKLNNARWHLIQTHSTRVEDQGQDFITNGDVYV